MGRRWVGLLAFTLVGTVTLAARAASVTFDVSTEFSGATPPQGSAPWIRAVVDDGGGAGSVTLTLSSISLMAAEFVSEWSFNLDPALAPASLSFSAPVKTGTFADPSVALGADQYQAANGGRYDIQITFENAPPENRFGAGDSVQYTITGIPSLTASSFDFVSAQQGGSGTYRTAAHVQAIGTEGGGSGWVTTTAPEPAMAGLLLLALGGLARLRARS